jgi:hypothetical protein
MQQFLALPLSQLPSSKQTLTFSSIKELEGLLPKDEEPYSETA